MSTILNDPKLGVTPLWFVGTHCVPALSACFTCMGWFTAESLRASFCSSVGFYVQPSSLWCLLGPVNSDWLGFLRPSALSLQFRESSKLRFTSLPQSRVSPQSVSWGSCRAHLISPSLYLRDLCPWLSGMQCHEKNYSFIFSFIFIHTLLLARMGSSPSLPPATPFQMGG